MQLMRRYTIPYFFAGIGSTLELFPLPIVFKGSPLSEGTSDAQRIASDWYRVGWAIYSAIESSELEGRSAASRPAAES
jgi:hypothetical protein